MYVLFSHKEKFWTLSIFQSFNVQFQMDLCSQVKLHHIHFRAELLCTANGDFLNTYSTEHEVRVVEFRL